MEDEKQKQLADYIVKQLQSGLSPDDVAGQLRGAGWQDHDIAEAFKLAQQMLQPTPPPSSPAPQPTTDTTPESTEVAAPADVNTLPTQPEQPASSAQEPVAQTTEAQSSVEPQAAPYQRRGRFKTSWLLLKQSLRVLKSNRTLLRYPLMSILVGLVVGALFAAVFVVDALTSRLLTEQAGDELVLAPTGMLVALIYYVAAFFVTFLYGAGLAAHVLDLFRGKQQDYRTYMRLAWSKWPVILTFSAISATVGLILRFLEERFKLIGWVIAKVLGVLWGLATVFVVPTIVETDKNAFQSIGNSINLFKQTWGENIITRLALGGVLFLLYLLVFIPLMILLLFGLLAIGDFGIFIWMGLFMVSIIGFVTVEVAATNVLNTALYYFAQYKQIPASFDAELLNSVFQQKKVKGKQA